MCSQESRIANLTFCTYNIFGFNQTKIKYVSELLQSYSILLLQEHWMNNKQLSEFGNLFPGYCVHGISAIDDTQLLRGRPKGGVLIIYPDSLGSTVKYITSTSCRLCAMSMQIESFILFIFCLYMPCDINDKENLFEYETLLTEISTICIKYNGENVYIAGDLNTELSRKGSWHTNALSQFENMKIYMSLLIILMQMLIIVTVIILPNHIVLLIILLYLRVYKHLLTNIIVYVTKSKTNPITPQLYKT